MLLENLCKIILCIGVLGLYVFNNFWIWKIILLVNIDIYFKLRVKSVWVFEVVVSVIRVINLKVNKCKDILCIGIKLCKKYKIFDIFYDVFIFGLFGFKLKYFFINFGSNNGFLIYKILKYGKVLINIDLWVFIIEYEILLFIKEIKNFIIIFLEVEKGLVFYLEY